MKHFVVAIFALVVAMQGCTDVAVLYSWGWPATYSVVVVQMILFSLLSLAIIETILEE